MHTRSLVITLTMGLLLAACSFLPQPVQSPSKSGPAPGLIGARTQQTSVRSDEAAPQTVTFPNMVVPQTLEQASSMPTGPQNQAQQLDFVTGAPSAQQIKMPANGTFQLIAVAGPSFQILDNDATDGTAKIQLPSQTFDLYIRPEASSTGPATCPTPAPTTANGTQLLEQLDQAVLSKASQLNAAGQTQCVYLPSSSQRQNANCNSTSTGFQCSGSLNKTLNSASCPEMAIYAGAMNINHALTNSKLFVAVQNNLTINQAVKGVFSSRGDLNTSLNNSAWMSGVFVGSRSNNLNLSGSAKIQGLYSILNQGSLSMNLNPSAVFEGELCTTGTANLNRNGTSQMIYNPNQVTAWQGDLPMVMEMMCSQGNKPYTQTVALTCPTSLPATNGSLQLEDALYYMKQTLSTAADGHWYKLPGRPLPVPDNWLSVDKNQYVLSFTNTGLSQISTRWVNGGQLSFPAGMNQIGPEGGVVELPGVAKLEIPSGALASPSVVKLTQIKEAPFRGKFKMPPELHNHYITLGTEYASAIVRIDPFNTQLLKPASLFVNVLDPIYNSASAGIVDNLISEDLNNTLGGFGEHDGGGIDRPITVNKFVYFGKLVTYGWLNRNKSYSTSMANNSFSIQQAITPSPTPTPTPLTDHETAHFFFYKQDKRTTKAELVKFGDFFEKIYGDYTNELHFSTSPNYSGIHKIQVSVFRSGSDVRKVAGVYAGYTPKQECFDNGNKGIPQSPCDVQIVVGICGLEDESVQLTSDPNYRCPIPQMESGKGLTHELIHYFQDTAKGAVTYETLAKYKPNDDWWIEGGASWIGDNYIAEYLKNYPFADGTISIASLGGSQTPLHALFSIYPFDASDYPSYYKYPDNTVPGSDEHLYHVKGPFFFHESHGADKFVDMKNILDNFGDSLIDPNVNSENDLIMKSYNAIDKALKRKGRNFEDAYGDYSKGTLFVKDMHFKNHDFYPVPLKSPFPGSDVFVEEDNACGASSRFQFPIYLKSLETAYHLIKPAPNLKDSSLLIRILSLDGVDSNGKIENLNPWDYLQVSAVGLDNRDGVAAEYNQASNEILKYNSTEFDDVNDIVKKSDSDHFAKIPEFGFRSETHSLSKSQSVVIVASDARWPSQTIPCNNNRDCSSRKNLTVNIEACIAPQILSIFSTPAQDRMDKSPETLKNLDTNVYITGRFLDIDGTWFVFESRNPNVGWHKVRASEMRTENDANNQFKVQIALVKIPPQAKLGGKVYAVANNGATSNLLNQQAWPCSMLPQDINFSDFQVLSTQPCKK